MCQNACWSARSLTCSPTVHSCSAVHLPFTTAAPPPPADKPPLGCTHDAYKLLLSNVPLSVTEADLAAVLRQYGHVVQLVLSPDNSGVSCSYGVVCMPLALCNCMC
jgi:hypothetical protein